VSLDKNSNKKSVFDLIAPVYGLFYDYQKKHYNKILDNVQKELAFNGYKNIIDIGCGTGALCSVLQQRGLSVTGIDPAQGMLDIPMKKQENKEIQFIQASALERLPFEDKSFDISISSYVAHGLKAYERKTMYDEMSRITKDLVIFYDYNEKRAALTDIVEWLEGGDYFNFIRVAKDEMKEHFGEVRVIDVSERGALYICEPSER